jgi:hypothetical protein
MVNEWRNLILHKKRKRKKGTSWGKVEGEKKKRWMRKPMK